jgi:hypothetical protein
LPADSPAFKSEIVHPKSDIQIIRLYLSRFNINADRHGYLGSCSIIQ